MMSIGENPQFVHRSALRQSYQQSHVVVNWEDLGKGNDEFCLWSFFFFTYSRFLTCHKILEHGACGCTSPLKEGVLQIFNILKNSSPRPDLNLLTITPPRQLGNKISCNVKLVHINLAPRFRMHIMV
jgi:hypothetical protein